jgi:hypothetical protein
LVQAITGIPYYYRLFGYEMALDLGGGRSGFKPHIPSLEDGQTEPYRIRPASENDLPFIAECYRQSRQRSLVSCVWDQATWRYELLGKSAKNVNRAELRVIEGLAGVHAGEPVGYLAHPFNTWGPMMAATAYELLPGISWAEVTPTVIRYLRSVGEEYGSEDGVKIPFEGFGFWLGRYHPVYQIILDRLPRVRKPYAWFLRAPDLPAFLRRIAPVLESRLAASPLVGHTGEIKISFYRSGLRLVFEAGKLAEVSDWKPAPRDIRGCRLPGSYV